MKKKFRVYPSGDVFHIEIEGRKSLGIHTDLVQAQEIEDLLNSEHEKRQKCNARNNEEPYEDAGFGD